MERVYQQIVNALVINTKTEFSARHVISLANNAQDLYQTNVHSAMEL